MFRELKNPTHERIKLVLYVVITLVTVYYAAIATVGYDFPVRVVCSLSFLAFVVPLAMHKHMAPHLVPAACCPAHCAPRHTV